VTNYALGATLATPAVLAAAIGYYLVRHYLGIRWVRV